MATGGTTCEASTPPLSKIGPQWVRRRTGDGAGAAADYFKGLTVRVDAEKHPNLSGSIG